MKQINQLFRTAYISCKSDHAFWSYGQFSIWPWNFDVKVIAEFKEYVFINLMAILMAIMKKTYSKYGINIYICLFAHNLQVNMAQ